MYHGKAYNKKGNLKGYVKSARNALDDIRTGGNAGKELIDYFQNSDYKDVIIQNGSSNGERAGLITWNPTSTLNDIPNQDGSFGRPAFIGLAHELGHTWDRWENGRQNFNTPWYTAGNGEVVYPTEKVATWWENRIRAENSIGLRGFYSFDASSGTMVGEKSGRLLIPGTSQSEYINIFGKSRTNGIGGFGFLLNIPYKF